MNFLRNYLDKQKPKFEKGGKLEKFHSVFTGFESFLFVPNTGPDRRATAMPSPRIWAIRSSRCVRR